MTYQMSDFIAQLHLITGDFAWSSTSKAAEINAIAAALATDPTTHDASLETPPAALRPALATNTPYTNQVLRLVNRGKGGNLSPAAMGTAITNALSQILPPVNTTAPVASGTGSVGSNLTTTNGVWNYSPTSYTYQWLRGGIPITGGTSATYALVGADSGTNVSCRVTAINPAGSANATSNAIAVT